MATDLHAIETWAILAAEALQEVIDEAVEADPDAPEDEIQPTLRALLDDLDRIMLGGGSLMTQLRNMPGDESAKLAIDI